MNLVIVLIQYKYPWIYINIYINTYILIYTLSEVKPVFDQMSQARGTYNSEVLLILVYAGRGLPQLLPGVVEQELEPVRPLHKSRPHLYCSRGDKLQQRQS